MATDGPLLMPPPLAMMPPPLPPVPAAVLVHLAPATMKLSGEALCMAVPSYSLLPPEIKPSVVMPYGSQILVCFTATDLDGTKYATMQELALCVHGALTTLWLAKISNGHTPALREIMSDTIYCFPVPVHVQPSDAFGNALGP